LEKSALLSVLQNPLFIGSNLVFVLLLFSCRFVYLCFRGKGKPADWNGKFEPQGFSGKSPRPQGGSILPKKLAVSNLQPLMKPQERNKRR